MPSISCAAFISSRRTWAMSRRMCASSFSFSLRMSPRSPPVHETTITSSPSATYFAIVAAPLLDSSSGCACTAINRMPWATWLPVRLVSSAGCVGPAPRLVASRRVGRAPHEGDWARQTSSHSPRRRPPGALDRQDSVCRPAPPCPAPLPARPSGGSSAPSASRPASRSRCGSGSRRPLGLASWTTMGYNVMDDQSVRVTFELNRPADKTTTCTIQALARDFATVGSIDVAFPPPPAGSGALTTTERSPCARPRAPLRARSRPAPEAAAAPELRDGALCGRFVMLGHSSGSGTVASRQHESATYRRALRLCGRPREHRVGVNSYKE